MNSKCFIKYFCYFIIAVITTSCSAKKSYKAGDGELIFSSTSDISEDLRLSNIAVEEPSIIENTCWNVTDFDYQNSGISMESYEKIDADEYISKFSKNGKYDFYSHPIICDGKVYDIDSGTAKISAYSLNNQKVKKLWSKNTLTFSERDNTVNSHARLEDDVLYIATTNGYVIAFDTKTQNVLWKKNYNKFFNASPTVYNNVIYLINSNDEVYAIDKNNGDIVWIFDEEKTSKTNSAQIPPVAVYQGKIVAGLSSGVVLVLNDKGGIVWKQNVHSAKNDNEEITDIDFPPILFNGILVAGGIRTSVMGFDFRTGTPLWQIKTGLNSYMLHNNQGFGFFVSKDNENICFVISNGMIKWIKPQEIADHTLVPGYFNEGQTDKIRYVSRYFDSY